MRKHVLATLLLSLFALSLYGQATRNDIIERFDNQLSAYPQEKVHLHTDRDHYVPGEKIWFKAYVADASTHRQSLQSRYVYVDLISPEDTLIHRVMVRPEEGLLHGHLPITEMVPEGDYTLRAYTRHMENLSDDYFFKKNIRITPLILKGDASSERSSRHLDNTSSGRKRRQNYDVSFYPEGGNLLEGAFCTVAFKALNSDGTPATITGEIIDENDLVITSVKSFHAGMGAFSFHPEAGKKYTLKCQNSNGRKKQFTLPQALPNAYALAIGQINLEEKIAVEVNKSANAPDIPFYLLAHCRGEVLHFAALNKSDKLITFPEKDLPAGVIHLVLFDEQMNPLSERLVFNKNKADLGKVDFHTDKAVYEKRDKVVASLSLSDASNKFQTGHVSVSVIDKADTAIDSLTTILSTLLLSSDLKGYIDNPAYYLQEDKKSMAALDYLMMTHGWRRYNVPEVIKGKIETPQIPYQTSQVLSGNVKSMILSRPVANSEILVAIEEGMGIAVTDEEGRFRIQDFEYPDSTTYFIQALNSKGGKRVRLIMDKETFPPLLHAPLNREEMIRNESDDAMPNGFLKKAEQRSQYDDDMRIIHLGEVEVTAPIIKKEPRLEFWANRSAERTIRKEEIERWNPTFVSNVVSRLPGVTLYPNGDLTIRRGGAETRPIVFIDGMEYSWPDEMFAVSQSPLERVNVNMIESIDIITGPGAAVLGIRGSLGAISITTKRGMDIPSQSFIENIAMITPIGYQEAAEFYSPKYDTPEAKTSHVPDYRTTIFWKPDVIVSDENEEASFEFYTSDFPTTYSVVIEGLTTTGKIIRQVKEIVVE